MSYYVTTSSPKRRALWLRLFGVDRLPVVSPKPRWQVGRGEFRETETLAYDLDVARLHWMALSRAAGRLGIDVADVRGLPIKASADVVVETAVSDSWKKRPFVFAREQVANYESA